MEIITPGTEIVVDEDRIGLIIRLELRNDLLRVSHAIRHAQAVCRQITKSAPVVTPAGGDQAGRRQKTPARNNGSPGRRIVAVIVLVSRDVTGLKLATFDVREYARPELYAVA